MRLGAKAKQRDDIEWFGCTTAAETAREVASLGRDAAAVQAYSAACGQHLLMLPPSAPVLLAMEEMSRLRLLATRCFEHAGDVEEALQLVLSSSGIQRLRCNLIAAPFLHLSLLTASAHSIYLARAAVGRLS
jgi:hypothetical protein